MSLSFEARKALGDNSGFVNNKLSLQDSNASVKNQINNSQARIRSVGVDPSEDKSDSNFLIKALDLVSRPGYAADNLIREFTNEYAGSTPGKFDPLGAFMRGITGKEKTQGKDIMEDIGLNGDEGIFGGEAHWYNPSAAGAAGLALDIFNPLDATNWIGFGIGDDIVKGGAKGLNALNDAFGTTKAARISELLNKTSDVAGAVSDSTKAVDRISDLGAENVGKLIKQVVSKADEAGVTEEVSRLIEEGLRDKGLKATSKLDYKAMKPIQVGLQNPLSIGNSGMSVKLPGYKATGGKAKLPVLYPGKDIENTFKNIPGSEYVSYAVGNIARKIADTKVGQTLGRAFSTAFVPNTVPNSVVKKAMTASNMDELINLSKTSPTETPLNLDELKSLQEELSSITLDTKFDFSDEFSATDLKKINKGEYFSLESLAKKTGIKGISTDDMAKILSDTPFEKNINEIYDSLRAINPEGAEKDLFRQAAKIRKVMDLMYEQVPEGLKPYFSGVVKAQGSDLYPSDMSTHRLGMNVSNSPLMAYQFDYKGVPVSVVVNSGENFNADAWNRVGSTLDALDELPEQAIQALKGQIDISPVPIKNPDTSMTIGDTIVLGRIDKPTVAHEYGHIWDSVAGDPESYSKAILNDSSNIDNVITKEDLYSDYARSLFDSDNDLGIKEDLADSVSDYLRDRKEFTSQYPGRAAEIERMLSDSSISTEELSKLISEQRSRAKKVSELPRTEDQIKTMMDSVDQYAHKLAWEPGTKAYQAFRENFSKLFEETNWKTKQWQEQVEALFNGLSSEERKQVMDAAAQITGSEVPKKRAVAQFAESHDGDSYMDRLMRGLTGTTDKKLNTAVDKVVESKFPPVKDGYIPVYHITTPEEAKNIMASGKFPLPQGNDEFNAMSNGQLFFAPDPHSAYRWAEQVGIEDNYVMIRGEVPASASTTNYDTLFDNNVLYNKAKEAGINGKALKATKSYDRMQDFLSKSAKDDLSYSSTSTMLYDWLRESGYKGDPDKMLGDLLYGISDEKEITLRNPDLVSNLSMVEGSKIDKAAEDSWDKDLPEIKDSIRSLFGSKGETPLFSKQEYTGDGYIPSTPTVDPLTNGWSDRQVNALDNFLKWRNSVVKQYRQMGIPINELEKYVPFIPIRGLKKDEAETLKTVFGTGVKDANSDNFDTLMAELTKQDPNLKSRTTQARRPSEVNSLLKKPWLTEDAAVAMSIRGSRAIKAKEFNDFADEFIKTYSLSMDDFAKISNGSVPDGYAAYKIGVDQNGAKVFQAVNSIPATTEAGIDTVFIPKDMVDMYNQYSKVMFNQEARNGVLDLYDQVNRLYKKTAYLWNPGHIARDFTGNVFNNYLMGVTNPADYLDGLKVVKGAEGVLETPTGKIEYSEIKKMAEKMGIIDSEMAYEIPTAAGKTEGKWTKTMRNATYATDGWTRATAFAHNLKQGMNPNQAAAMTKKFLFDYMDLTPFERKVMRRIVPFYTWMRKNIPLQLEVLLKNPRIYSRINSVQNAIAGENIDWEDKPDYIQDMGAIQPINSSMYTSLSLPYQDLSKVPVGADMDALSGLLSSVSPIIRAPIESATNTKWWTGQNLENYSGEQQDIPLLTTLLQMLGGKGPQVDARVTGNLLDNVPLLNRAGNLLDSLSGKETSDARNLSRISTTLGGPSFYDASSVEKSGLWQERQRLVDLIQLLKDQGYEVPTTSELNKSSKKHYSKSDMRGYDEVPHKK